MSKVEVTIYLKSGQSLVVFVEDLMIRKNGLGELKGIDWENKSAKLNCLRFICVEDISAIVSKETGELAEPLGDGLTKSV